MYNDGTTLQDGTHELLVYKVQYMKDPRNCVRNLNGCEKKTLPPKTATTTTVEDLVSDHLGNSEKWSQLELVAYKSFQCKACPMLMVTNSFVVIILNSFFIACHSLKRSA